MILFLVPVFSKSLVLVLYFYLKDQCLYNVVKKSEKFENLFIVWSQCVLQWLNSCTKKLPMFKIEQFSSDNLSFRLGVLCLHWNSIEIKPRTNIQSP